MTEDNTVDDQTENPEPERAEPLPQQPVAAETQLPARRVVGGDVEVGRELGGLRIKNMGEVIDLAKLMSGAGAAVPAHLRNNPGMCWAICLAAIEWRMSPFAVANKSYVTNDRLNYESQLIHAVIEARAPLKERLRVRYEGEGADRVCIVSGTFKGEKQPREHRSPPLKDLLPPFGDKKDADGNKIRKGSPLWTKKPDVQMFYDTSRDFCRIYCPDVLLGIYTPDEIEQYADEIGRDARDVTADADALHARLAAAAAGKVDAHGFHPAVVTEGLGEKAPQQATEATQVEAAAPAVPEEGGDGKRTRKSRKAEVDAAGAATVAANAEVVRATPAEPTDTNTYMAWVRAWLQEATTVKQINDRWAKERSLRNTCGMTLEDRAPAEKLKNIRIRELGG